jgi:hypothetical protein
MRDDFSKTLLGMPQSLPSSRVGIAETFPRWAITANAAVATNQWAATAIYLPAGLRVVGITMFSGGTALGTGVHQWFGLWDSGLALLGGSADDTSTAWAAHTAKRLTLTTPLTTTYAGRYFVGAGFTATTVPTLACISPPSGATRVLTPYFSVWDIATALTSLANPLVQAANTSGNGIAPYAVLD